MDEFVTCSLIDLSLDFHHQVPFATLLEITQCLCKKNHGVEGPLAGTTILMTIHSHDLWQIPTGSRKVIFEGLNTPSYKMSSILSGPHTQSILCLALGLDTLPSHLEESLSWCYVRGSAVPRFLTHPTCLPLLKIYCDSVRSCPDRRRILCSPRPPITPPTISFLLRLHPMSFLLLYLDSWKASWGRWVRR